MRGYFGLGQLSPSEKSDILDQHKQVYNGYKTMLPQVSNTQPLYVQDYANDKNGITMNNKGEVKHYTNFGINEQVEKSQLCNECGSGYMEEGVCNECGSSYMEEETGHLDDIYDEQDFDPTAGFDYIEGSSNDVDTFEGSHKKLYDELGEQGGNATDMDVDDVTTAFNFNSNGPMDGGDSYPVTEEGNMDDPEITYDTMESAWMDEEESFDDLINMDSAIESDSDNLEQMESDLDEVDVSGSQGIYADMDPAYDFDSGGAGPAGPYQRRNEQEFRPNVDLGKSFEKFKGKKSDDHGIESFFKNRLKSEKNIDNDNDLEDDELDVDFDKFDPREKSWEEITDYTGDDEFGGVDEDMVESLIIQKNRIMEMMNRMNVIK